MVLDTQRFVRAFARNKWTGAASALGVVCLLAAGCSQAQEVNSGAPSSTDVGDVAPTRPPLPPAATRPRISPAERDAVLKAWPEKRAVVASLPGFRWSQGPILKGFMRTKSSEWQGTSLLPPPPPKDSPLATRLIPDSYDVWVVRGAGVITCGALEGKCSNKVEPLHWAIVFGSDGELYASLSYSESGEPPPDLSAIGVPAEEFDVA